MVAPRSPRIVLRSTFGGLSGAGRSKTPKQMPPFGTWTFQRNSQPCCQNLSATARKGSYSAQPRASHYRHATFFDNLHPALLALKQPRAGFHCFRRFRESVLQMSDARNLLIDFWMGHENRDMGTRYAKQLIENIEWRKECERYVKCRC